MGPDVHLERDLLMRAHCSIIALVRLLDLVRAAHEFRNVRRRFTLLMCDGLLAHPRLEYVIWKIG